MFCSQFHSIGTALLPLLAFASLSLAGKHKSWHKIRSDNQIQFKYSERGAAFKKWDRNRIVPSNYTIVFLLSLGDGDALPFPPILR